MSNNFRLVALDKTQFSDLFSLIDVELASKGMKRMVVDEFPGFPCRVSLADAEIGEEVILLNFEHHNVNSPYRADGPIFVRKISETASPAINEIPKMFNHRLLSIRGFDKEAIMIFADVTQGENLQEKLHTILENQSIDYLHIHNARPGCYNCLVERV
jgi:Protein of unknown function (DUF1203)